MTKPSARADAKAKQAELATKAKAAAAPAKLDVQHTTPSTTEIEEPEQESLHDVEEDEEMQEAEEDVAARAVSTAQISRYWAEKERARKAPRVHQQDLDTAEKVLREFDMESRFGVCSSVSFHLASAARRKQRIVVQTMLMCYMQPSIGIKREARWRRAYGLGLAPPMEVLAVLLREQDADKGEKAQTSIVDQLMSTRVAIEA